VGEVLSQSEIDSLLAALSTGELEVDETQQEKEKHVKNYDFPRSICVLLKLYMNIIAGWYRPIWQYI